MLKNMFKLPKYIAAWCGGAARFWELDFTCQMRLIEIYTNHFKEMQQKKLLSTNYCQNEISKLNELQDYLINK